MISKDEANVLRSARKAIFQKIETSIDESEGPIGDLRFKNLTDSICALGVIEQIERADRKTAEIRLEYFGEGKCNEFNVYIDGTETERGTRLDGVEKVILPELTLGRRQTDGYSTNEVVCLEFNSLENAAAVLGKSGGQRLEIRGAVMCYDKTGGYSFHGHQYIMNVYFWGLEQAPLERNGRTAVTAAFRVDSCTVIVNGKKLWETGKTRAEPPGTDKEG